MNGTTIGACVAVLTVMVARRVLRTFGRRTPRRSQRSSRSRVLSLVARRRRRERVDWAAVLEQVAAELRTGASLTSAIAECLPVDHVGRSIAAGDTLVASLARVDPGADLDHDEASDRRMAMGTLIAVASVGGSGGAAIERTADTIRERHQSIAERHAQAAQARLSAVVLSALPPVFALWSVGTDARVRSFLLTSALGGACLGLGVALNLIGWWWMRRLTGASGR